MNSPLRQDVRSHGHQAVFPQGAEGIVPGIVKDAATYALCAEVPKP